MDYARIVGGIPDYKTFCTVAELDASTEKLAAEFPDKVTVAEAGKSRSGSPIRCIKIGNGPRNALMFACPHPNEPIGAMTCEFFSRLLAQNDELRNRLGFTWYIIKCVDPDGTRLNEKWFKGPFDIYHYARNFFRPTASQQVEWTFPFDYKTWHWSNPLPETKALMRIMEETRPKLVYSLHNAGFGGCYWYITREFETLYQGLYDAAKRQNVALNLGEPEAPYCVSFAPAVYRMMGMRQEYDYVEKYTGKAPKAICGTSSGDYALRQNPESVTFLNELPYFFDPRIQDLSEGTMSRRDALLQNIRQNDAHTRFMVSTLEPVRPYLSAENPFVKMVDMIIDANGQETQAKRGWAQNNPEFEKPATVASVFDNLLVSRFYNSLYTGMTARACEYELERAGGATALGKEAAGLLRNARNAALEQLKVECDRLEHDLDYQVISIKRLVSVQTECGIKLAELLGAQG